MGLKDRLIRQTTGAWKSSAETTLPTPIIVVGIVVLVVLVGRIVIGLATGEEADPIGVVPTTPAGRVTVVGGTTPTDTPSTNGDGRVLPTVEGGKTVVPEAAWRVGIEAAVAYHTGDWAQVPVTEEARVTTEADPTAPNPYPVFVSVAAEDETGYTFAVDVDPDGPDGDRPTRTIMVSVTNADGWRYDG